MVRLIAPVSTPLRRTWDSLHTRSSNSCALSPDFINRTTGAGRHIQRGQVDASGLKNDQQTGQHPDPRPRSFRFSDYWPLGLPIEIPVVAVSIPMLLIARPL